MSSHRLERTGRRARRRPLGERRAPRARRSGRARALFSLGTVVVLCAGLSVKGTFAFWTDQATLATGSFTTGTLDITIDGNLSGTGGTYSSTYKIDSMLPGESYAFSLPVKNAGTAGLTYNLTATGSGGLAVTNGLQYIVYFGSAAVNSGTQSGGNRAGTCGTGNTATDANSTVLNSTSYTFASNRALSSGSSETVCIIARLNSSAPNALQSTSGQASFVFDSKQA